MMGNVTSIIGVIVAFIILVVTGYVAIFTEVVKDMWEWFRS